MGQLLLAGLAAIFLWFSFPRSQFQRLKQDSSYQHQLFATAAILSLLFFVRAGLHDGLELHFVGLTAVTLALGWRMACLCGAISLFPLYLMGHLPLGNIGVELFLGIYLPVMFSYLMHMLVYHHLPRQLFVFVFVTAFLGGALTFVVRTLVIAAFYLLDGTYSWPIIADNYLVMLPLFLVPEAMLNGMAIVLMVVYRPQWISTFNDNDYLKK